MCLFTNTINFKITTEDIVAYKVLIQFKNDILMTPYYHFPIELNKKYYDKIIPTFIKCYGLYNYKLTKGCFHLFNSFQDANNMKDIYNNSYNLISSIETYIVVKAIIPKDTQYIEGINSLSNKNNICAKSVIYKPL